MDYIINDNPTDSDIFEVRHKLQLFNVPFWNGIDRLKFVIKAIDNDQFTGGITFSIFGKWLEIEYLWVDNTVRKTGVGSKLVSLAECKGKEMNCFKASLNTFGFQARPFYEKLGYTVVHIQENEPNHITKYFLEKNLSKPH